MDYLHLYNHRIRMMNPAKKSCQKCGSGYRGTRDPEEVLCAKCAVLHCQVPGNIDEEFLRLVKEYHGSKFASVASLPTDDIMLVMEDILDHKKRLQRLENDLKNKKQDKGRMRMIREIKRIKEEKDTMEERMKRIKDKFMLFVLTMPTRHQKAMMGESKPPESKKSESPSSVAVSQPKTSPTKNSKPVKQEGHAPVQSVTVTDSAPVPQNRRSPPRKNSPPQEQQKRTEEQISVSVAAETPSPKTSPVKQAAAKFEEAAKRVKSVVTFATNIPSVRKSRISPPTEQQQQREVNNNTPVTASSEEDEIEQPGLLRRSNSVKDRIKRFEDMQRRASTGSYDRKKAQASAGGIRRQHKSMTPLNH